MYVQGYAHPNAYYEAPYEQVISEENFYSCVDDGSDDVLDKDEPLEAVAVFYNA